MCDECPPGRRLSVSALRQPVVLLTASLLMLAGGLVPFLPGSTESPVVFGAEPPADAGRLPEDWTSFRNGRQLQGLAGTTLPEELELL